MAKKIESGNDIIGYVDNDDWVSINSWQQSTQPQGEPQLMTFELFNDAKLTDSAGIRAAGDKSVTTPSLRWTLA